MRRLGRWKQTLAALTLALAASVFVAAGCAESQIESTLPAVPSSTEAVIALPIAVVSARVRAALDAFEALDRIFGVERHAVDGYADSFMVEGSDDPVFAPRILSRPENRYDLYAYTDHEPIWLSPVHRRGSRRLPFIAAFHLHLEAIDDEHTRVTVLAIDSEVITGMSWGVGSCGPGRHYDYRNVAPTTIEEGLVLRYLVAELVE